MIACQTTDSGAWMSCTETMRLKPPAAFIKRSTGSPMRSCSSVTPLIEIPTFFGGARLYWASMPWCGCGFEGSAPPPSAPHTSVTSSTSEVERDIDEFCIFGTFSRTKGRNKCEDGVLGVKTACVTRIRKSRAPYWNFATSKGCREG